MPNGCTPPSANHWPEGADDVQAGGLVKVVLAYPWMIGVLIAIIGYQLYRVALTPGVGLVAPTVFDAIIVVLTCHEYRHRRRRHHRSGDRSSTRTDNDQQDGRFFSPLQLHRSDCRRVTGVVDT